MRFLHRFILLRVEVAEVQRPQDDLFFSHLVEQAVERVAKFFGYPKAQEQPVVFG